MTTSRSDTSFSMEVGVEGARLACITPEDGEIVLQETLEKYVSMFYKIKTFISTMALFSPKQCSPTWFREPFPDPTVKGGKDIHGVLMEYCWPTPLWTKLTIGASSIRLTAYQPNLVDK